MSPVLVMAILVLVYFYSHYLFASGTVHVVAMYAAIMLGLTGAFFQSTTHYSCGPDTALFAPGYVKQTDWWKMCFILGLFYLLVYGVVGGLWMKLIGLW